MMFNHNPARHKALHCALLCLLALACAAFPPREQQHRYCIVGAGPGGLQLAHYLQSAGREYVVLDKAQRPGSFFETYPRWRQLISINKRATGSDGLDYSMRHDWNSLLSEPSHSAQLSDSSNNGTGTLVRMPCVAGVESPHNSTPVVPLCAASTFSSVGPRHRLSQPPGVLFSSYSSSYYPEADKLVSYLDGWARAQDTAADSSTPSSGVTSGGLRLHIRFNTSVSSVERHPGYDDGGGEANRTQGLLRLARGQPRFLLTLSDGSALACSYLIWAAGLQQTVPPKGLNLQQAIAEGWVKTYTTASTRVEDYVNKSVLLLGRGNAAFEMANNILEVASRVHLIGQAGKRVRLAWESHYPGDVRSVHNHLLETYLLKSMDGMAEVAMEELSFHREEGSGQVRVEAASTPCSRDEYGRAEAECLFRHAYDVVISCSGWKMDLSPFVPAVRPTLHPNGKHPAITGRYESVNVPGLYFAGTLAHGHDHKKSSGGFIHGFRYTARALHRILEEEEQEVWTAAAAAGLPMPMPNPPATSAGTTATPPTPVPIVPASGWPRTPVSGLRNVASALLRRINNAAGPYQMFGTLVDVLLLPPFPAARARGFKGAGTLAACHEPWSFYDPAADTEYIQQMPPPAGTDTNTTSSSGGSSGGTGSGTTGDEGVIDAAMSGAWLFEEVPVQLVHERVAAWRAQLLAAAPIDGAAVGTVTPGLEYIILSLEFGSGSSSHGYQSQEGKGPASPYRDPFSLTRANVSLSTPETSHFLHPVLRYYHTGVATQAAAGKGKETKGGKAGGTTQPSSPSQPLPPTPTPLLETHVIEDFNIDWTHHVAHILPVTRMLQDVGAKRAHAALAQAGLLAEVKRVKRKGSDSASEYAGISSKLQATSGGFPGTTLHARSSAAITQVFITGVPEQPDRLHDLLFMLLPMPGNTLWYGGKAITTGSGWFNKMSVEATMALVYGRSSSSSSSSVTLPGQAKRAPGPVSLPRLAVLHFLDTTPVPLTLQEVAYNEGVAAMAKAAKAGGMGMDKRPPPMPVVHLTPEQRAGKAVYEERMKAFYRRCSQQHPHVPFLALNARLEPLSSLALSTGIPSVPFAMLYSLLPREDFVPLEPMRSSQPAPAPPVAANSGAAAAAAAATRSLTADATTSNGGGAVAAVAGPEPGAARWYSEGELDELCAHVGMVVQAQAQVHAATAPRRW